MHSIAEKNLVSTNNAIQLDEDNLELAVDAFIRAINIAKNVFHGLYIGAGASITSGMPSAQRCIWEWKRDIFLTNNPGLKEQFSELSLESVKARVQTWLDKQGGYPLNDNAEEYKFYIEKCYPISNSRRAFFQEHVRKANPFIGYKLLCLLAEERIFNTVFTPNFDSLVAKAAANFDITPIEVGIDTQGRLPRTVDNKEFLIVSMHGDYRYDELKNTEAELKQQEKALKEKLVEFSKDSPLIVMGYSGRDQSVMDAFVEAYSQPGTGALYWCGTGDLSIPPHIKNLLMMARSKGRTAYYISTTGFDDVMQRLAHHCLEGEMLNKAKALIDEMGVHKEGIKTPFSPIQGAPIGLIKSNAFEIDPPAEIFQCEVSGWPEEKRWGWLDNILDGRNVVAAPAANNKLLFWGNIDQVKDAFGERLKGAIERAPVTNKDLVHEDGKVCSLIRRAVVSALAAKAGLRSDENYEIWENYSYKSYSHQGVKYYYFSSALLYVRNIGRKLFIVVTPSIRILDGEGQLAPTDFSKIKKNEELSGQYNKQYNEALNKWAKALFSGPESWAKIEFPEGIASSTVFRIRRSPILAQINSTAPDAKRITIDSRFQGLIRHQGLEVTEPKLLFSNKAANGSVKDPHPIRGILDNKPHDFGLTLSGLMPSIKVGIICPRSDSAKLSNALQTIKSIHKPQDKERDYLFDFPGFEVAFSTPIEIAQYGGSGWHECLPPENSNPMTASREAAQSIIRAIDELSASQKVSVIAILIPDKWKVFWNYRTETESFDLHDFVKAYAVQKGIATQFIEEETFRHPNQCRVWWWLSLALYAKSMRTPWILDGMDKETAYVGLGFSIDHMAPKGSQVTLGCSHLYSHQGQGLQYRLTRLEDPIIRGRNAFMSLEDARRLGEKVRELFFEERMRLPNRVVLHKNTPFLADEKKGLIEGLSGVNHIDLVQVEIDSALKYMSSYVSGNTIQEGMYPVKRGTVLRIDDYSALSWVHGSTQLTGGRTYYQGKRRIPAPMRIRKFAGDGDLSLLVSEIMGLSKMNWNTFDLYTQLPASIESSGQIAKIGNLLGRFRDISYDYRLFM